MPTIVKANATAHPLNSNGIPVKGVYYWILRIPSEHLHLFTGQSYQPNIDQDGSFILHYKPREGRQYGWYAMSINYNDRKENVDGFIRLSSEHVLWPRPTKFGSFDIEIEIEEDKMTVRGDFQQCLDVEKEHTVEPATARVIRPVTMNCLLDVKAAVQLVNESISDLQGLAKLYIRDDGSLGVNIEL